VIFSGRRVVLGVSGGIASYKACTVARRLTQAGAEVDVVLTASGAEFVRPVTFEALTGRPVLTSLWDRNRALDHIRLAQDVDLIIVAPATANVIARAAQGIADDALTAILLAKDAKVLLAPAMNDRMFSNPATQKNLDILKEKSWGIIGPAVGSLAEGLSDQPGRMSEPEEIMVEAERVLGSGGPLDGKRVVVTAGPTREPLDPVRVVSNRSSGLMGFELARSAYAQGADVRLIAGPTVAETPIGPELIRVETTADMLHAVENEIGDADMLIMAAAPADYSAAEVAGEKRPRGDGGVTLNMKSTPDVLVSTRGSRKPGCFCIGFALETSAGMDRARKKMASKELDMIVYNRADQADGGMESADNKVVLVTATGEKDLPLMSKRSVADEILLAAISHA
jgi:phosphopantothenoylcysteine decarboxylase/phosphopantothenate--cysteine ligase